MKTTRFAQMAMRRMAVLVVLGLPLVLGPAMARADTIIGVTVRSALGGTDSVDWGQLGPDDTLIPSPFVALSANGNSITVRGSISGTSGGAFLRFDNGGLLGTGNFALGDKLVYTNTTGGPVTFAFSTAVAGAGFQLIDASGTNFDVTLQAFNGATLLGSFTETNCTSTGVADNSACFVGVSDLAGPNITSVVASTTSANIFSFNQMSLASPVPEPSSLLLLGAGLLGLWPLARRRIRTV